MYNLTINGVEIQINIENSLYGHNINYSKDGLTKRLVVKSFTPDFKSREIIIEYWVQTLFNGVVITERPDVLTSDQYDYFYNFTTSESLGVALAKNLLNGILHKEFNYRCFDSTGQFHPYVAPEPEVAQ